MEQSIVVGPFALQASVLVALAALGLGWFVAGRIGRRAALKLDPALYAVTAAGLLAARIGFVLQNGAAYLASPASVLNIRDGGWSPAAGFAVAVLATGLLALRRRALGKPLAAGLATAAAVWFAAAGMSALVEEPPARLPALSLRTLDGGELALQQLAGRPVVLNLWATWCPPCIREMPTLQEAQRQRPDVQFVFVNQGETAQKVQAFLGARQLAIGNVLLDANGEVAAELGARALPTTVFFDAQGRLQAARVGELTPAMLSTRLASIAPAAAASP